MKLHLLLLLCLPILGSAQVYVPGQTYWSPDGFIEYRCGSLPLIITAPHGGYLSPDSLPTRSCPGATTIQDGFTLELAQAIDSSYGLNHACRPHVIISHLHRRKLDPNRDSSEASCDDARSMAMWRSFHSYVQAARDSVQQQFGRGLLLDLHGHGHTIQRIELGYQLTGDQLRSGDSAINTAFRIQRSGIRSLVALNLGSQSHSQLLRGNDALGTWLQAAGYLSVPSQQDTAPQLGQPYFSGGYITERHGSMFGGNVDAVQLEHYMTGLRNTHANRARYADSLRVVTNRYLQIHYFGNADFLTNCQGTTNSFAPNTQPKAWYRCYPNPGRELNVNAERPGQLHVYNLHGQKAYSSELMVGLQTIATRLPAGLYVVAFESEGILPSWLRWVHID